MVLKPLKIRPPGTFCWIILQPDRFFLICMSKTYQGGLIFSGFGTMYTCTILKAAMKCNLAVKKIFWARPATCRRAKGAIFFFMADYPCYQIICFIFIGSYKKMSPFILTFYFCSKIDPYVRKNTLGTPALFWKCNNCQIIVFRGLCIYATPTWRQSTISLFY